VHADWMIPYREEPITKGALRNKHFEAFKNKYGSFPKIGVKVKLKSNSKGYWRIVLD
jgi:hypothetical protein